MLKAALVFLVSGCRSRLSMALEIVALRHQLDVLQRNAKRPRLKPSDRALWAVLCHVLPNWRQHLTIVKPETVVGWHRSGWRLYWRWRCRSVRGRPKVTAEVRALIRKVSSENRLWGAPHIHGGRVKVSLSFLPVRRTLFDGRYMGRLDGLECLGPFTCRVLPRRHTSARDLSYSEPRSSGSSSSNRYAWAADE